MNSNVLKLVILSILMTGLKKFCFGQIDTSLGYIKFPDDHKTRIIKDHKHYLKLVLDTSHIYVEAINENGNRLWKTDPWSDAKLPVYRMINRPKIVTFYLLNDSTTKNKDVIAIMYENSQSGFIDVRTGKFRFFGQD
jgi:hypothetical protein